MTHRPDPGVPLKVLLLENISTTAHEIFAQANVEIHTQTTALSEAELLAKLPSFDLLGIRSKTQVSGKIFEAMRQLQAVGCFCIGTNQVDLEQANVHGVPVFNAPFSNTRSVAELIVAEIIALARQLGDRSREVHEGRWRKVSAGCFEVRGKTLGIVGYGHIGSQVGVLAESLGMRVLFHDIASKLPMGNVRPSNSLAALLAESDFVTLHVPSTPQTKNLIGAAELAQMKKDSYLLNMSRGNVVAIPALAEALKKKHLAGAAVDVYPEEPESNGDTFRTELQGLPNVLLTPHIGGSTEEAQAAIGKEVATALTRFVRQGATTGSVNFPQVELAANPGTHRVLNVHRNVPGVLRDINRIVSDMNANIHAQVLATDPNIGCLVMDLEQDVAEGVSRGISGLPTSIRTRIV